MEPVLPIEEINKDIADFLVELCNHKCPYGIRSVIEIDDNVLFVPCRSTKNTIGRNDLCYCGSGKKYKKCCGN